MQGIKAILEREVLPVVSKPGRYIGGEVGITVKQAFGVDARIALAFPDVYEIGMSHLGLKLLYSLINREPRLAAERVFAPWPDMERRMREVGIPLYSLETFTPLKEFDVIGFTLQHELTYTNILTMLDLAGIPLLSSERKKGSFPLVVAGGAGAYSPTPLEEIIDIFVVGDGEDALLELMDRVVDWKRGAGKGRRELRDLLLKIAQGVEGTYVPSFYRRNYSSDERLVSWEPLEPGLKKQIRRRVGRSLRSLELLQGTPVPNIGIVHDRVVLEVRRGCTQGCRFCQAGMIYRPVRDEDPKAVPSAVAGALKSTGYDEVSLCSLSIGDYPGLDELIEKITDMENRGSISLSLPSLRPDQLPSRLAKRLSRGRRTGITLAPEAGTEELRRRINKKISIDEIVRFATELREQGWRVLKLYFMIGLPGETNADLNGILDIIRKMVDIGRRGSGDWGVNVTISPFIPKPHTPFQWEPMETVEQLRQKQEFLRRNMRLRGVKFKFHDVESSLLEAAFSRGSPKLGEVLCLAWQNGCRFDGWRETFRSELWRGAFEKVSVDPRTYAYRSFADDDCLPWDMIETGVSKRFLLSEREKCRSGETTPDCAEVGCVGCGVCTA